MANAATLSIDLLVQTAKLQAGFAKAQKISESFASRFKQGMIMGAGMAAFQKISGFVENTIGGIFEKLEDLGKVQGIARKFNIGVEALQGFQLAGKQFGVDGELLEKGFRKLNLAIAEAAGGSNEAEKKLAKFGLKAKDLRSLPLEETIFKISDAMQKMTPGERLLAASELFGERNTELLKVFSRGGTALRDYIAEAKKNGEIASPAQIAAMASFRMQWKSLGAQLEGIKTKLAICLIDPLQVLVDLLNDFPFTLKSVELQFQVAVLKLGKFFAEMIQDITFGAAFEDWRMARGAQRLTDAEKALKDLLDKGPNISRPKPEAGGGGVNPMADSLKKLFAPALIMGSPEAYSEALKLGGMGVSNRIPEEQLAELKKLVAAAKAQNKITLWEAEF